MTDYLWREREENKKVNSKVFGFRINDVTPF